jgi:hypothetical protein
MYADNQVPASREQYAVWSLREQDIVNAIQERLLSDSENDSDTKGKGKAKDNSTESEEVLPTEGRHNLDDAYTVEDTKGKGKGKEKDLSPYNFDANAKKDYDSSSSDE